MGLLPIFLEVTRASLVRGAQDATPFTLPDLHQGTSIPIEFSLVRLTDPLSRTPLETLSLSGYSLRISVGIEGTTYAAQTTWTANSTNTVLSGALDLRTAPLNALSSTSNGLLFEAIVTDPDGNPYSAIQSIGWRKSVYVPGDMAPEVEDSPITASQAIALLGRPVGSVPIVDSVTQAVHLLTIEDGAVMVRRVNT